MVFFRLHATALRIAYDLCRVHVPTAMAEIVYAVAKTISTLSALVIEYYLGTERKRHNRTDSRSGDERVRTFEPIYIEPLDQQDHCSDRWAERDVNRRQQPNFCSTQRDGKDHAEEDSV